MNLIRFTEQGFRDSSLGLQISSAGKVRTTTMRGFSSKEMRVIIERDR